LWITCAAIEHRQRPDGSSRRHGSSGDTHVSILQQLFTVK